jgi:hypothetical protein
MSMNALFLRIKQIHLKRIRGDLYSFQTEVFRGIQEGSPPLDDTMSVRAFDAPDRSVELLIGTGAGANSRVTQDDINHVLVSLRLEEASKSK